MNGYIIIGIVGLLIAAVLVGIAWPWLKQKNTRDPAFFTITFSFFIVLAAYLYFGAPFQLRAIEAKQAEYRIQAQQLTRLSQQLPKASDEKRAEILVQMAAIHMQRQDFKSAVPIWQRAVLASQGSPQVIMAYGKAQMMAAEGKVTEGAQEAFAMASRLLPEHPEPLFYLALGKMQENDNQGAIELFSQLLPKLPEDAPMRFMVTKQLEKMRTEADLATPK